MTHASETNDFLCAPTLTFSGGRNETRVGVEAAAAAAAAAEAAVSEDVKLCASVQVLFLSLSLSRAPRGRADDKRRNGGETALCVGR